MSEVIDISKPFIPWDIWRFGTLSERQALLDISAENGAIPAEPYDLEQQNPPAMMWRDTGTGTAPTPGAAIVNLLTTPDPNTPMDGSPNYGRSFGIGDLMNALSTTGSQFWAVLLALFLAAALASGRRDSRRS